MTIKTQHHVVVSETGEVLATEQFERMQTLKPASPTSIQLTVASTAAADEKEKEKASDPSFCSILLCNADDEKKATEAAPAADKKEEAAPAPEAEKKEEEKKEEKEEKKEEKAEKKVEKKEEKSFFSFFFCYVCCTDA